MDYSLKHLANDFIGISVRVLCLKVLLFKKNYLERNPNPGIFQNAIMVYLKSFGKLKTSLPELFERHKSGLLFLTEFRTGKNM